MHRCDGLALGSERINHMPNAANVLKKELFWVLKKDVRLRCSVDIENVRAILIRVWLDGGNVPRELESSRRMGGHAFRLVAISRSQTTESSARGKFGLDTAHKTGL